MYINHLYASKDTLISKQGNTKMGVNRPKLYAAFHRPVWGHILLRLPKTASYLYNIDKEWNPCKPFKYNNSSVL